MLISELKSTLSEHDSRLNVMVDTIDSYYSIVSYTYLNDEDELILECGQCKTNPYVKDLIAELEKYGDSTIVKISVDGGKEAEVEAVYNLIDDSIVFLFAFEE